MSWINRVSDVKFGMNKWPKAGSGYVIKNGWKWVTDTPRQLSYLLIGPL